MIYTIGNLQAICYVLYYNRKINVILSIANVQSNVKEVCKIQKTILVAYYSQTGQTKKFAEMIAKMTNADVYEIVPVRKYNDDMWKAWDEAQIERAENKYPALRGGLPDISKYDTVIIGGGVWGFTLANPIFSFMKAMDFAGKKVSSFWTFYDQDEKYNNDMRAETRNGTYKDGLALPRSLTANKAKTEKAIEEWLKTI